MTNKAVFLWLFCLILGGESLWAQVQPESMQKYAQTIQANDLKAHLSFLASDELEGRETGTHGQRVAARYIATQFMRMGLKPGNKDSWFLDYKVAKMELQKSFVKIGNKEFKYRDDFFTTDLATMPSSIPNSWKYGLDAVDIRDKNVLVVAKASPNKSVRQIVGQWYGELEKVEGAASIWMVIPDSIYEIFNVYARPSSMSLVGGQEEKGKSIFFVNETMGKLMVETVAGKGSYAAAKAQQPLPKIDFSKLKLSYTGEVKSDMTIASNVMGFLEGTDKKDEVLVLTAHYDHLGIQDGKIYNGADDDGSGTVSILELAEAFTKAAADGVRPRRSILFMTVSGEEKGLWGSEYYSEHPVYPIEKTVANLNIDMIGRVDERYEGKKDSVNYVYVIGADKLSSELDSINRLTNDRFTHLTLDYKYNDPDDPNRFYYRSDHYNFARKGIPVIFYFTGVHEDYHKPGDDVEKIRFPKMVTIARLVFGTAWELVNRDKRIVVDKKPEE